MVHPDKKACRDGWHRFMYQGNDPVDPNAEAAALYWPRRHECASFAIHRLRFCDNEKTGGMAQFVLAGKL
jgi:hypothetical protein